MDDTLADVAFLSRSGHRVGILRTLAAGPRDREALRAATGASDPTVGRILGDFESRGWVRRRGHEYVVTGPGAFVADRFASLLDQLAAERRLRDVWRWLPAELDGFALELVADAEVTVVEPGDPYGPANRCASLYRETDSLRAVDAALTAPHHFAELYGQVAEGTTADVVLPAAVSRTIAETYPERAAEVLASGNLSLWLHDDLPLYRLLVFDDRVGIGGYDPDSGVLQAFVDTAAPDARAWVVSTIEALIEAARPLDPDGRSA